MLSDGEGGACDGGCLERMGRTKQTQRKVDGNDRSSDKSAQFAQLAHEWLGTLDEGARIAFDAAREPLLRSKADLTREYNDARQRASAELAALSREECNRAAARAIITRMHECKVRWQTDVVAVETQIDLMFIDSVFAEEI